MSEIQVGGGGGSAILYHVRIRGKIYGPYPIEKLQDLAKKSVVSRINQVSVDGGNSWQPASEFTEIFEAAAVQVVIPVQQAGVGQVGVAAQGPAGPLQATSAEIPWYYLINGQKHGPTTLSQLQMMVSTGTLNPADYACQEGAADWSRVDMVPELMSVIRGAGGGGGSGGGSEDKKAAVAKRVVNAFVESRAWTLFLGILILVYAALLLTLGIWVLAAGSEGGRGGGFAIGMGITWMVSAIVWGVGAMMLIQHSGTLRRFASDGSEKKLVIVAESLARFWLYVSIVAIVYLIMTITGLILILAGTISPMRYY